MQKINHDFYNHARRIAAHRQTWFQSNSLNMSAAQRRDYENNIQNTDRNPDSRWRDDYAAQRSNIAVYDVIDAENVRARGIADAVTDDDIGLARTLAKVDAPIKVINQLLKLSNLPITIEVLKHEEVVAIKNGGQPYSIAELSDGERNALLIAANVLTVKPDTLLLIDEPERHLHRSIVSPLLTLLFKQRSDCSFVISTHEVMLPIDNAGARTLLLHGCTYQSRNTVTTWDVDEVPPGQDLDEALLRDILGGRRKILFVEGTETSLDKPLYSLIFPDVSIIAKASCRDVEHSVSGIRDSDVLHWIRAFGLIDNDRRSAEEIAGLKAKGVYALSVYAVESLYFHAEVQRRIAERFADVTGDIPDQLVSAARDAALSVLKPHARRLAERVAERAIRDSILTRLPNRRIVERGGTISLDVNVDDYVKSEQERFQALLDASRLADIIALYPVRETPALDQISKKLGFRDRTQYEAAVRKLLMDDQELLEFMRSLLSPLSMDINGA